MRRPVASRVPRPFRFPDFFAIPSSVTDHFVGCLTVPCFVFFIPHFRFCILHSAFPSGRVQRGFSTGYSTALTFKITRFYAGPYGCTGWAYTEGAPPIPASPFPP